MSYAAIVANNNGDPILRANAKVIVVMLCGDGERAKVSGLNRAGRKIVKWVKRAHLINYRAKWVRDDKLGYPAYETKEEAAVMAAGLEAANGR